MVITGQPSAVEVIEPFTKGVIAKALIPLGTDVGKASLMKLTGNTMILGMVEVVAEALVFAEKSGLSPKNLDIFIQQMFPHSPFVAYSTRMLSGRVLSCSTEATGLPG